MLRTLLILRHGETADRQPGQSDFHRVLTNSGQLSIQRLAARLTEEKIFPELILSSDAIRAVQTSELLVYNGSTTLKSPILYRNTLYTGSEEIYFNCVLDVVSQVRSLLVVGHNPSVSALVGKLTRNYAVGLHPGEVAIIQLNVKPDGHILLNHAELVKRVGPL
jgi:phosphohistidine phosphatase